MKFLLEFEFVDGGGGGGGGLRLKEVFPASADLEGGILGSCLRQGLS